MSNLFKKIGYIIVTLASFFYVENTTYVLKNADEIMIKIRERKMLLDKSPIEAIIKENTIIPGINGYEVDVSASYSRMKYLSQYNDAYLKYKKVTPVNTLEKNKDKIIISGNKHKNEVAIILVLKNMSRIMFVNGIDEKITIFLDGNIIEDSDNKIINKSNVFGIIGYNYNYDGFNYRLFNRLLKEKFKRKTYYCLVNDINVKTDCERYNNFTIHSEIIKKDQLKKTKSALKNGIILIYEVNKSLVKQYNSLINYITSKGYNIVNLDDLLEE